MRNIRDIGEIRGQKGCNGYPRANVFRSDSGLVMSQLFSLWCVRSEFLLVDFIRLNPAYYIGCARAPSCAWYRLFLFFFVGLLAGGGVNDAPGSRILRS